MTSWRWTIYCLTACIVGANGCSAGSTGEADEPPTSTTSSSTTGGHGPVGGSGGTATGSGGTGGEANGGAGGFAGATAVGGNGGLGGAGTGASGGVAGSGGTMASGGSGGGSASGGSTASGGSGGGSGGSGGGPASGGFGGFGAMGGIGGVGGTGGSGGFGIGGAGGSGGALIEITSATLGTPSSGGASLSTSFWPGWRFEVDSTSYPNGLNLVEVGFNGTTNNYEFFAAIVELASSSDQPDSYDLTTGDVLLTKVFTPGTVSAPIDITVPLSLNLSPGWYAVVFGTHELYAMGGVRSGHNPVPGAQSIFTLKQNPPGFVTQSGGMRVYVRGAAP